MYRRRGVGRTCETFFGLASIPACILATLGVTGVAGEAGPDAPSNVLLTVPEAVRFEPAVDAAMDGLAGKGLCWGFAPEGGTMGVVVADIKGGDPREEEEGE